jgi:hypothetical protein
MLPDDVDPIHLHQHNFELTKRRRNANFRRHQGRCDDRCVAGDGRRFQRRSAPASAVPLPYAASHGFRIYGSIRQLMEATPRRDHPISGLSLRPELPSQGHRASEPDPTTLWTNSRRSKANGGLERALTIPSKSATNRHQKLDKPAKIS